MAWLVHDGRVLATLEVADTRSRRSRGLLGRSGIDGALLLRPTRSIHTLGMRFAIDAAFCDDDFRVVRIATLRPNRLTLPVRSARAVVEAEAGMFARWGVAPGDQLEVRGTPHHGDAADHDAGGDASDGDGARGDGAGG
jgi:uncharacterized protein